MDYIGGVIQAIMFFFGIWKENEVTQEQCDRMRGESYLVYPLNEEDYQRLQKCNDLFERRQV